MMPDTIPARTEGRTYNGALTRMIESLARHKETKRGCGVPLWSVVRDLCCCGSTSACELIADLGLDPHVQVLSPEWPDPSCQAIVDLCPECGEQLEEGICSTCAYVELDAADEPE